MSLNLLPSEAKFQAQRMRIKGLINNFLWVVGGIWLLLIVAVFGINFVLNLKLKQLNTKYQAKSNEYKSMIEEVALTQKIKYQAKVVAKVLNSRFEYGSSMNLVSGLFSENVKIDDIQLNKDKSYNVSGGVIQGKFVSEIEEKVNEINDGEIDGFSKAKISSLELNKEKGWLFSVQLFLK